ncbi:Uncharacterized protein FWK35_00023855 [Aphis craccivora]|uniref:Uncharacterized protein n=1 Tax=Aphis craccivora TaxID=307492 RepID=A0A6G0W1J2_APHCR|nr:Uncharacterized protein FWK35_00023855 [Aphis craccivora]
MRRRTIDALSCKVHTPIKRIIIRNKYICYYFLNPIWKRESEQDSLLSRAELVAIHGKVFREDAMIETNYVITPIHQLCGKFIKNT